MFVLDFVGENWKFIVAALAGIGMVSLAARQAYLWIWRFRFKNLFGFKPEKNWVGRRIQQVEVDRELSRCASHFHKSVVAEDRIIDPYFKGETSGKNVLQDLEEWKNIQDSLLWDKRHFWTAHGAARIAGFSVKEKYADYLK